MNKTITVQMSLQYFFKHYIKFCLSNEGIIIHSYVWCHECLYKHGDESSGHIHNTEPTYSLTRSKHLAKSVEELLPHTKHDSDSPINMSNLLFILEKLSMLTTIIMYTSNRASPKFHNFQRWKRHSKLQIQKCIRRLLI